MSSFTPEIPDRLLQNNRPPDNVFTPDEELYRRIEKDHINGDTIELEAIKFPDFSVNRQKYCETYEDVLIPNWKDWGVASFKVKDVPQKEYSTDQNKFTFHVEHVPLPLNYPHSEVRTRKNGMYDKNKSVPSSSIKKLFRMELREKIRIIKKPK